MYHRLRKINLGEAVSRPSSGLAEQRTGFAQKANVLAFQKNISLGEDTNQ